MAKPIIDFMARNTLRAKFLDRSIPLQGASHADIVEYGVDTPLRYSECFGRLADGRKIRLTNSRQFVAWAGRGSERSFLFQGRYGRIEVIASEHGSPGSVQTAAGPRKFVARDGEQIEVQRWGRAFAVDLGSRSSAHAADEMYALPQLQ